MFLLSNQMFDSFLGAAVICGPFCSRWSSDAKLFGSLGRKIQQFNCSYGRGKRFERSTRMAGHVWMFHRINHVERFSFQQRKSCSISHDCTNW